MIRLDAGDIADPRCAKSWLEIPFRFFRQPFSEPLRDWQVSKIY